VQTGVAHHDFGLVTGSKRSLQLREIVGTLIVHNVVPGDVILGMLSGECSFNRVQASLLGSLCHIVENGDFYVFCSGSGGCCLFASRRCGSSGLSGVFFLLRAATGDKGESKDENQEQCYKSLNFHYYYDHTFPLRSKAPKGMKPKYLRRNLS